MDEDKDFPYQIAYDEAVRALSQQQSMIDSLRTPKSALHGPPETKRPSPMQPAEARGGLSIKID